MLKTCSRPLKVSYMLHRCNISLARAASSQREYIHCPPGFFVTYQLLVRLSACRPRSPICTECHQRHCTYLQQASKETCKYPTFNRIQMIGASLQLWNLRSQLSLNSNLPKTRTVLFSGSRPVLSSTKLCSVRAA